MKKHTILEAAVAANTLKRLMGNNQLQAIADGVRGEESQHFVAMMVNIASLFGKMPTTGATDGQGDKAIAYLHYFHGNMDWYITERDVEKEQHQAFGYVNIGYGYECGYISLIELAENNIELDLYFTPNHIDQLIE